MIKLENMKKYTICLLAIAAINVVGIDVAQAQTTGVLDNLGQTILDIFNSAFLRAIAIVAVVVVGLSALSGRIAWMTALTVILGIVIIFGAAGIVDFIKVNATTAQSIDLSIEALKSYA